jgi:hypothetical protein
VRELLIAEVRLRARVILSANIVDVEYDAYDRGAEQDGREGQEIAAVKLSSQGG